MAIFNRNEAIRGYESNAKELQLNLNDKYRSKDNKKNDKRLLQRDLLMLQFLHTIPESATLSGAITASSKEKMNAGALAEMVFNYHHKSTKSERLAISGGDYDGLNGCISYEVKLCVNGSCYNTALKEAKSTYLITADGVFFIPKAVSMAMVNAKGIFPYKKDIILSFEGVRLVKSVSVKMGFTFDDEAEETEE